MKSQETHVRPDSDYYIYSPSQTAEATFFYPLCTGHFYYQSGYRQFRSSYDSFLMLYLMSGELTVEYDGKKTAAPAGSFLLLDCYQPHGYHTAVDCECVWCHFDGPMARAYYDLIVSRLGHIFSLRNSFQALDKLTKIYQVFSRSQPVREAALSGYLTDILTACLTDTPKNAPKVSVISEVIFHIQEHFAESLSLDELAAKAAMSPYHFIRVFKKETGYTPHEYLIQYRISTAKYMLKNTELSIKDICFSTGFSSESSFCTAFKKETGFTPVSYRKSDASYSR